MSLEDRPVPYDKTATRWKIARQIAKLPKNLVNESLVFTSPNTPRSTPKESRVRVLEKRINELEERENRTWQAYNELYTMYEQLSEEYAKLNNLYKNNRPKSARL